MSFKHFFLFSDDLKNHHINKTIDELLAMLGKEKVQQLLIESYIGNAKSNEIFRQTLNEISSTLERITNSGLGFNTVISQISSITIRSFAIGTMTNDFVVVFDALNERLNEEIKLVGNQETPPVNSMTSKQIDEFKSEIFLKIKSDLMKRLKIVIN